VCLQGFVNEYPDVKIDQLVNVLLTRGDVSKGEARQVHFVNAAALLATLKSVNAEFRSTVVCILYIVVLSSAAVVPTVEDHLLASSCLHRPLQVHRQEMKWGVLL